MTRLGRATFALVLAGATVVVGAETIGAQASGEGGPDYDVEVVIPVPGTPASVPSAPQNPDSPSPAPPPVCRWVTHGAISNGGPDGVPELTNVTGTAGPDATFYVRVCNGEMTGEAVWSTTGPPAAAAPLPDPAVLAAVVRVRLEGNLPAPEVASDPGVGVPSVINSPVFVQVANWSGVVMDGECDPTGALCVTVTATPSLTWSPGEPGAAELACGGSGSRYDPSGPTPEAQAQGACAHTFRQRTGVEGRPAAWDGTVTVTWDLVWTGGGTGGTLQAVTKSASVPRPVGEVQAIVTEVG